VDAITVGRHLPPRGVDIADETQIRVVGVGQFVLEFKLVIVVTWIIGPVFGGGGLAAEREILLIAADIEDVMLGGVSRGGGDGKRGSGRGGGGRSRVSAVVGGRVGVG
jgi:hypothetical protein